MQNLLREKGTLSQKTVKLSQSLGMGKSREVRMGMDPKMAGLVGKNIRFDKGTFIKGYFLLGYSIYIPANVWETVLLRWFLEN